MQPTIWNDERITAYVLGELSPEESSQLETEMQSRPEIAKAVDEARGITTQLSAVFAAEPEMTLDALKRDQIFDSRQVIPAAAPVNAVAMENAGGSWKRMLALAATVLLIGTLGTWLYATKAPLRVATLETAAGRVERSQGPSTSILGERAVKESDEFQAEGTLSSDEASPGKKLKATVAPYDAPAVPAPESMSAPTAGYPGSPQLGLQRGQPESRSRRGSEVQADYGGTDMDMGLDKDMGDYGSMAMSAAGPAAEKAEGARARSLDLYSQMDPSFYKQANPEIALPHVLQPAVGEAIVDQEVAELSSPFGRQDTRNEYSDAGGGMGGLGSAIMLSPQAKDPVALDLAYEGRGAGMGGDRFEPIQENEFRRVSEQPLSTFSIDVDTASYSKVRQFLMQSGTLPPAGAVRIEELVNYFDYAYEPPAADGEHPFASRVEIAACPWKPEHRLARIAIKGKVIENRSRPASNLVFLVDTSGSMNEPKKLPLVKQGLQKLVGQLDERDRVAIVVYAGSAGLVLDSTPASQRSTILRRINQMQSGGSTNGGQGIRLAYQVARDHFINDGVNRVILCSDGDFNVGTTSDDELVRLVETESKGGIDITVLGFGMGNHNDSMMEKISGRGNGNYAFIDSEAEAQRVLVEQTSGTLVTIARDVKIQVNFNPAEVAAYRLIGYENRKLANEDFKDDTKDAGEVGAGHSVTALYELIPASGDIAALAPAVDELKYQRSVTPTEASQSGECMTVSLRYKKPDSDTSIPVSFPARDERHEFTAATHDFRFAAAVAGFGMLLRSSEHVGNWTLSEVQQVAAAAKGDDPQGQRTEFVELVRRAAQLRGSER